MSKLVGKPKTLESDEDSDDDKNYYKVTLSVNPNKRRGDVKGLSDNDEDSNESDDNDGDDKHKEFV